MGLCTLLWARTAVSCTLLLHVGGRATVLHTFLGQRLQLQGGNCSTAGCNLHFWILKLPYPDNTKQVNNITVGQGLV
jgi:hypothetical protein